MGIEPPYIYQKPSKYSFVAPTDQPFNPKSVTQASWAPKPPPPKPDGPLINAKEMNRHPDSYFIVPYGNLDWKPMSPRTKTKVKWIRIFQLFLRICALLGALGLLFCVICIKPIGTSLDWIIRIPPGIAILHTVYGMYHLSRSSKGRTPASSASYMIFAAIVDAGILPFLAFTALLSKDQYLAPNASGHWTTLFGTAVETHIIIYSTFLISTTTAGIHAGSLCISIYLALIFRKISKLPPDMNPLEDNLTSRHKRNKSAMSVAAASDIGSNRDSHLSAPLMDAPRNVPFMHTRNNSASSLSVTTHRRSAAPSNRDSRTDLPSQIESLSQRSSRSDLRRTPRHSPKLSRSETANLMPSPLRTSFPSRPDSSHQTVQMNAYYEEDAPGNENWVSHPSPTSSPDNSHHQHTEQSLMVPHELRHLKPQALFVREGANRSREHSPSPSTLGRSTPTSSKYNYSNRPPRPLSMNPPTPRTPNFHYEALPQNCSPGNTPEHSPRQQQRSHRSPLHSASGNNNSSPATFEEANFVRQRVQGYEGSSDVSSNGSGKWFAGAAKARFYGSLRSSIGRRGEAEKRNNRVVSSGRDEGVEREGLRGRDVSGKIAEEGRGGIR